MKFFYLTDHHAGHTNLCRSDYHCLPGQHSKHEWTFMFAPAKDGAVIVYAFNEYWDSHDYALLREAGWSSYSTKAVEYVQKALAAAGITDLGKLRRDAHTIIACTAAV